MNLDYTQIIAALEATGISDELKKEWKKRIPDLSIDELKRVWEALHATAPEELDEMIEGETRLQIELKKQLDEIVAKAEKEMREVEEEGLNMGDEEEEKELLEELDEEDKGESEPTDTSSSSSSTSSSPSSTSSSPSSTSS